MEGDDFTFAVSSPSLPLGEERCLADKVGLWLRMAQKAFCDLVNNDFQRYRVTQLDFLVLSLIEAYPGCRQTMIAQRLDIKSPNLAAAIDYLVQRGFVTKTPDPVDRRANHLALTDSGRTFVEQLGRRYLEITRCFFPEPDGVLQHEIAVKALKQIARRPYLAASPPSPLASLLGKEPVPERSHAE